MRYTPEGKYIQTEKQKANNAYLKPFQPGQSGNPKGKPTGKEMVTREIQHRLKKAEDLQTATTALYALRRNSLPIITEIMAIALEPSRKVVSKSRKTGETTVRYEHSQAKLKALGMCVERIIPVLKVVEMQDGDTRAPHELTDQEIIQLMQKMANMAGNEIELTPDTGDRLDG